MKRKANLLGALAAAIEEDVSRVIASATGLSVIEGSALSIVGKSPGCSIRYLSVVMEMTHPGAVRVVDRLVLAGLLGRGGGPDGRTVGLFLTSEGEQACQRQGRAREARLVELVRSAGEAGQGFDDRMVAVVEKWLAMLTRDADHGEHICRLCDESACPQTRCPVTLASR